MTNDLAEKLKYRMYILEEDCKLIRRCLNDGAQYHNLDLLENHLKIYRELVAELKKN